VVHGRRVPLQGGGRRRQSQWVTTEGVDRV
jgi:hypothetical protein